MNFDCHRIAARANGNEGTLPYAKVEYRNSGRKKNENRPVMTAALSEKS